MFYGWLIKKMVLSYFLFEYSDYILDDRKKNYRVFFNLMEIGNDKCYYCLNKGK